MPRLGWLADMLTRLRAALRADLTRPAMDRRILHRLGTLSDPELRDIGLVRRDIDDAAGPGAGDVSAFLIGRRDARRTLRRQLSREGSR